MKNKTPKKQEYTGQLPERFMEAVRAVLDHPGYNHLEMVMNIRETLNDVDWDEFVEIIKMAGSFRGGR